MTQKVKVIAALSTALLFIACTSSNRFRPQSQYPPDPWVKGYASPDDCIGGEALAARHIPLPDYPKRALRQGLQGWAIIKLDVDSDGYVTNIAVEDSVPEAIFARPTKKTVSKWKFQPLNNGKTSLRNCRVLIRYRMGKVMIAK